MTDVLRSTTALNELSKRPEALVRGRQDRVQEDSVLRWNASNVTARQDYDGIRSLTVRGAGRRSTAWWP